MLAAVPQWIFCFWALYFLKLDITFLRGGGWVAGGGGGGGSKVFAKKAPSSGEADRYHTTAGRMVTQPMQSCRSAVGILVGRLLAAAVAPSSPDRGSNRRPKRMQSAALPFGHCLVSPLLGAASATDKKPKLCVSVRLTAGRAKGLIG